MGRRPKAFAAFTVGLIIVAYGATMTVETAGNTLVKMLVQPALIALLVVAFGIETPLGSEAVLICALLTSVVPAMFGRRYRLYETEAPSTLLLTTLAMIVVMPMAIALTGA